MWNKKSQMRNRYLQLQLPSCKAKDINEYTITEMKKITDLTDPVEGLKSIQPVKSKMLGDDKANLAFGTWGLPKLLKEICSDDSRTQTCAMNTLSDVLLNELECTRAILQFEIVRRLQNILLRRRIQIHKDQKLVGLILKCYEILACSLAAAELMAKRPNLIHEFYVLAEKGEYRKPASHILRTLTQHPQILDYFLTRTNWFNELSEILHEHPICSVESDLLEHFSHFIEVYPQIALEKGFFEIIIHEIPEKHNLQQIILKCFTFLVNCKEGQSKVDKCDGVRILYELLMDEHLNTYEYVLQALQSVTAGSPTSLWRCREFWNLPHALIRRAHVKNNDRQQLYSLQTLRQITTMPSVKQYVRKVCVPQIRSIECRREDVRRVKEKLLIWLRKGVCNK